jgi:hypothetical protein
MTSVAIFSAVRIKRLIRCFLTLMGIMLRTKGVALDYLDEKYK